MSAGPGPATRPLHQDQGTPGDKPGRGREGLQATQELVARLIMSDRTPDVEFRITPRLDWKAGDYADGGSCFFSYNSHMRAAMVNEGGGALNVRKRLADGTYKGTGRCWLVPREGNLFAFNFEGVHYEQQLAMIKSQLPRTPEVKLAASRYENYFRKGIRGGVDKSFYTNGNVWRFYTEDVPLAPTEKTLDGCRCCVLFSSANPVDGLKVCEHCPFAEHEIAERAVVRAQYR